MSNELTTYDRGGVITPGTVAVAPTGPSAPTEIDQWVLVVRDISRLAAQIADTPFVPDSYRGNPAAITAAILTGREMGLGPLTSLQHIFVIKGKPGQTAQIMRGMVLAAGHEINDVEVTDTRAVIEGRRRGEGKWTRVTFTADQAKKAGIALGGYPEDKLYARATTRLCRRKFADVIGGIAATVEELEDGDPHALSGAVAEPPPPPAPTTPASAKRTAKRRTAPKAAPSGKAASSANAESAASPAPRTQPAPPPSLPGDDDHDDQSAADDGVAEDAPVSREQLDKLHAQLGEFGITDRADKLTTVGQLVGRVLTSSNDLTRLEAGQAIDVLSRALASENPPEWLEAILRELEES